MARINDRLIIQLVDSKIVVADDSSGVELVWEKAEHALLAETLERGRNANHVLLEHPNQTGTIGIPNAAIDNMVKALAYLREYA